MNVIFFTVSFTINSYTELNVPSICPIGRFINVTFFKFDRKCKHDVTSILQERSNAFQNERLS